MKKKSLLFAAIAVVVIGATVMFMNVSGKTASPMQVETVPVKKGNISMVVTATGTIEPIKEVSVGTQVSGVVQKIYVDYNSKVKAGQLIAELDKTNLRASLAEAKANYNTALNEQAYLQKIYDRQAALYKTKVISQLDYEEAQYKLESAKSAVEQKKSDLNRAETNLGYADIYSPIDGVVLSKAVDVGQTVAASFSTPTLFTIAQDLTEMQVQAKVDEADIGGVKEGQRVTFTVDAFQGEEFSGKVTQVRLNATVTSNVVTYTVVINAKNPEMKLMPGLTATISIFTTEMKDVLTLQAKALAFSPDANAIASYNAQMKKGPAGSPGTHQPNANNDLKSPKTKKVWVKAKDGSIEAKNIEVGKSDGINVQIESGLSEGEEIVCSLASISAGSQAAKGSEKSPFMPAPPGQKKK